MERKIAKINEKCCILLVATTAVELLAYIIGFYGRVNKWTFPDKKGEDTNEFTAHQNYKLKMWPESGPGNVVYLKKNIF